jgi:hypothetical protein
MILLGAESTHDFGAAPASRARPPVDGPRTAPLDTTFAGSSRIQRRELFEKPDDHGDV